MKVYAVAYRSLYYKTSSGQLVTFTTSLVDAHLWSEDSYEEAVVVAKRVQGKVVTLRLTPWGEGGVRWT